MNPIYLLSTLTVFFLVSMPYAMAQGITYEEIQKRLEQSSALPKFEKPLSDPLIKEGSRVALYAEKYIEAVFRIDAPRLEKYQKGYKHSRINKNGMNDILKILKDQAWDRSILSDGKKLVPGSINIFELLDSGVVDGVYTWNVKVPLDIAVVAQNAQAKRGKRYSFKVKMIRSNARHHANHITIDQIELIE